MRVRGKGLGGWSTLVFWGCRWGCRMVIISLLRCLELSCSKEVKQNLRRKPGIALGRNLHHPDEGPETFFPRTDVRTDLGAAALGPAPANPTPS